MHNPNPSQSATMQLVSQKCEHLLYRMTHLILPTGMLVWVFVGATMQLKGAESAWQAARALAMCSNEGNVKSVPVAQSIGCCCPLSAASAVLVKGK